MRATLFRCLMIVLLLFCAPGVVYAWTGKVVKVADGDSIRVLHGRKKEKIRLYGIDTPEKAQPYGTMARLFTTILVVGRQVEVRPLDRDGYGRTVAIVSVNGKNVNRALVAAGLAWVYRDYCHQDFCQDWKTLEENARKKRLGLWADNWPCPPWQWRHGRGSCVGRVGSGRFLLSF